MSRYEAAALLKARLDRVSELTDELKTLMTESESELDLLLGRVDGNDLIVYATNFALGSFANPGTTSAYGLSGYWQPASSGWIPSISAGWGLNSTRYSGAIDSAGLVATSQSWSVGLQWQDAFSRGNALGMAVGQPTFATSLQGGATANDGNLVWEWWYKLQLTDQISLTPALFYLSRPLGADTPTGESFRQLGGLLKSSFRFLSSAWLHAMA
jgi:hypothetical protein